MSWSSLPDDLWKLILTHVPLPERLGGCSRVSKKLCRAAAAATEQLEVNFQRSQQRAEEVVQWLQHKGQYVTSLVLDDFNTALTELPCPQLHELVLCGGKLQLGPSSSHPGVLHSCTGLTKLVLWACQLIDETDSLAALSAVPALQHLDLSYTSYETTDAKVILPGSILQVLTKLTNLRIGGGVEVTAESLQHISALQHLQVLIFYPALGPSSTPGLAQLTALHTANLASVSLDAAVLQHHTQLQRLELAYSSLPGANSGAVLLSVIGQQLRLRQLKLTGVVCQWPTAAAAYTALTASSRLQQLTLQLDGLPAGIWQAMLKPQHQLPHLTKLKLGSWDREDNEDVVQGPPVTAFSSTDISRLVACCPQVQCLGIRELHPDAQLAALSQLTALTALTICKATESSVKSLPDLSQLKALEVFQNPPSAQQHCCT